jgi:hypothetical protein
MTENKVLMQGIVLGFGWRATAVESEILRQAQVRLFASPEKRLRSG